MNLSFNASDELKAVECLPDDELLRRVRALAVREYAATARLVAHLAEVDARRLYLGEGYASLYLFCVLGLKLSEHAAYGRIRAARIVRRFPRILDELSAGNLTLTAIVLLTPHLTGLNHLELMRAARGKTRREIEEMLAARQPLPPANDLVRRLSRMEESLGTRTGAAECLPLILPDAGEGRADGWDAPPGQCRLGEAGGHGNPGIENAVIQRAGHLPDGLPAGSSGFPDAGTAPQSANVSAPPTRPSSPPPPPARLSPLDAAVYRVQFTARAETYRRLIQVRELMRHQVPDGDLATIFDRALGLLYQALARRKFALVMGGKGAPVVPPTPPGAAGERDGVAAASAPGAAPAGERAGAVSPPRPAGAAMGSPAASPLAPGTFRLVPPDERRRYIPATVRRVVWLRDGGRCTFTSAAGLRCVERGKLEFHHRVPYARGGPATPGNLELRCRAHNVYEEAE